MEALAIRPDSRIITIDFGDLDGLPNLLRKGLQLAHFHVTPRGDLAEFARELAVNEDLRCEVRRGPRGYYQSVTLTRHAPSPNG